MSLLLRPPRALLAILLAALAAGCGRDASAPGRGAAGATEAPPPAGTAVVSGTTIDAATGEPLAGVEVTGPGEVSAVSDARGRFRLEGLPVGASGEVVARTHDGRTGSLTLRPLANARLEVVLHLR
ncbi:MAG TPA: carboxypeptidase regulatory-like domain-containing protein [Planctomycetota bacterium]|nr:carboxypeptidase regulatory-like domain-containing protein [Planctomycetota bacterium]